MQRFFSSFAKILLDFLNTYFYIVIGKLAVKVCNLGSGLREGENLESVKLTEPDGCTEDHKKIAGGAEVV